MSTDVLTASVSPSLTRAIRACPFDLVARARLALEGCTRLTNPDRGGQPYSYVELHTEPPIALHAPWDYSDVSGRLLDALTLARIMTETAPDACDAAFVEILSACQQKDGLMAVPADPWTHTSPIVEMEWSQRGALMAWTTRALAMDDTDSRERAKRLVQGLHSKAVWEGDTCWFPASYLPATGWTDRQPPVGLNTSVLIGGQIVFPLVRFAEATGNSQSMELANGLIRFLRERSGAFEANGKLTSKAGRYFHSNTNFILGVLKYGLAADREEYVDWAQDAYREAREHGTEFGFFPHGLTGGERWQGDACAILDMIQIALLLGMHKDPACFADAERFGRNHLLESQLLGLDWVVKQVDAPFCQELWCANHPPEGVTTQEVCDRTLGTFAAWTRCNDAFDPANPRLMQRCSGAGTRGLYDLWRYSVTRPEGAVMVNMHFSRDTRWATVTSHVPQEGCIEVLMKTRGVLAVRVPPDVTDPDVLVNQSRPRHEIMRGGYAWLEALQPGDLVTVKWPQKERAMRYDINGMHLTGYWKGDTLLRMNPPGQLTPLYWRPLDIPPAPPHGAHGPVKEIDSI